MIFWRILSFFLEFRKLKSNITKRNKTEGNITKETPMLDGNYMKFETYIIIILSWTSILIIVNSKV